MIFRAAMSPLVFNGLLLGFMMQRMRFEGNSDDTFGEYSLINEDHDNCASGGVIAWKVTERTSIFSDDDVSGMIVCGQYSGDSWPSDMEATWLIGISRLRICRCLTGQCDLTETTTGRDLRLMHPMGLRFTLSA